jgi:hypothetical protein
LKRWKKWQWKCQFNFFLQKSFFFVSEKQVIHFAIVLPRCFPISLSFSLQLRLFMFLKTLNKHLNLKKIHFFVVIRRTPFVGHCCFFDQSKICFPPFEDFHLELYKLQNCFLIWKWLKNPANFTLFDKVNLVNVVFNLY